MKRRTLIKRSALVGLAGTLPTLLGEACATPAPRTDAPGRAAARPAQAPPSPLGQRGASALPAAFVVARDAEVLDFTGPLEVFAGAYTPEGQPLFAPYVVAERATPVKVGGAMQVLPDYTFGTAPQPKVIVIPAMRLEDITPTMCDWLRTASSATELTMSVCNGAFALAKAGLLDGRAATAHHGAYFRFAGMFPKVRLQRGARFVEDGGFASSGGISSGIDLALRVVERYLGTDATLELADGMEYQGDGWRDAGSNDAYARLPLLTGDPPRCPVCLAPVDRTLAATHRNATYYFCSREDRDFFAEHTATFDQFLDEDARRPA